MVTYINFEKFKEVCVSPWEYFAKMGEEIIDDKGHRYIFIDNDSDILAVAHLDTVQTKDFHFYVLDIANETWVFNPQLDDRMGAYAILDLLPEMGLKYDILLTEDEEIGKSTAQYFETNKEYKWMFEFDRRGEDVVHYQYGTEFLKKRLNRAGFKKIEYGMKSDIWYLDFLGCCGFNVGIGYQDEHTLWSKANINVFIRQVNRFAEFYEKFKTLHFKYEKPKYKEVVRPVLPVGFSYSWFNGSVWRAEYQAWGPKEESPKSTPVTSLVERRCPFCQANLKYVNESAKHPGVCKVCEPTVFHCVGCDSVKRISFQSETALCSECNTIRIQEGDDKFYVCVCCETSGCFTPLSWTEYKKGLYCTECENQYDDMFRHYNDRI